MLTPILATEDPYRTAAISPAPAGWLLEFETPPDSGDRLACVSLAGSKVLLGTSEPQFLAADARPFRGAGVEFHIDVPSGVIDAIHLINKASKGRNGGQELAGHASLSTHPALCPGPQRRQGPRHGPDLTVG